MLNLCQDIIIFWDQTKPIPKAPHEEAIDVGQTIWRVPHCEDATPCLLPNSLIWLRRSFRLLEPLEGLTLQGLPRYTFESIKRFRNGDLSCLAGNAFCGHHALALMASAICAHPSLLSC